jgi:hypothetical protein
MPSEKLLSLQDKCRRTAAGPVLDEQERSNIEDALIEAWDELRGTNAGGMTAEKLVGRIENLQWQPPRLSFDIERHGGTMLGSVYADIQHWSIDVEFGSADFSASRRRQLYPKDAPLNAKALAEEIAQIIISGGTDRRLKWDGDSKVILRIGEIIPPTNRQTTSGRRKRFIQHLVKILRPGGWNIDIAARPTRYIFLRDSGSIRLEEENGRE